MPHEDRLGSPHIFRLSISDMKGQKKQNVRKARILVPGGFEGDAHADTPRPVSLLPYESFGKLAHDDLNISPGDFAENITTVGVDFENLDIGTKIALGKTVVIEVIQIGKECHNSCIIRQTMGDCIMPREGVFARVLEGGMLKEGDPIKLLG